MISICMEVIRKLVEFAFGHKFFDEFGVSLLDRNLIGTHGIQVVNLSDR